MKNWLKLALISLFLFSSCTSSKKEKEIYVEPTWLDEESKSIDIFASNNFSAVFESSARNALKDEKEPIHYGGAELLLAYRKIILDRKSNHALFLDTGNFFDSSADIIHHKATSELIKELKYDALLMGHHEINALGNPPKLLAELPFLNSHIFDLKTAKPYESDGVLPTRLINRGGLKVGVLAITQEKFEVKNQMSGLYFEDSVLGILRNYKELKKQGADIIILLARLETKCQNANEKSLSCPREDPLHNLISRLPPKTIDLIITSTQSFTSGLVLKTPVIMSPTPGKGQWLSRARIKMAADKEVTIELMPPLSICDRFYFASNDCNHPIKPALMDQKVPAKFWGHEIIQNDEFTKKLILIRTKGSLSP